MKAEVLYERVHVVRGLVERIGRGDLGAEAEFVRDYTRALRFLISRRVADTQQVSDLIQETLQVALVRMRSGQLDQPELLGAFLRSIALNLLAVSRRECGRETTSSFDDEIDPHFEDERNGPVETVLREQYRDLVRKVLAHIPRARDREILRRHYVLEQDKVSLCEDMNLTPRHFDRVLFRARARFRLMLERYRLEL